MWDTVQRRVLLADLNAAWYSDDEQQGWQQVGCTEAYSPLEPLSADTQVVRDVYSLGVSFAVIAVRNK